MINCSHYAGSISGCRKQITSKAAHQRLLCVRTAGPHGTKLASGGDRTSPVRSCRDMKHPPSKMHNHQHIVKLRESPGGSWSHTHTQNQPKSCFAFHQRVCYKHLKQNKTKLSTAPYKPNIKVISKLCFYVLFYCQPPRAILFLATVWNREAGIYFTMITHQECIRSYTHTLDKSELRIVFSQWKRKRLAVTATNTVDAYVLIS